MNGTQDRHDLAASFGGAVKWIAPRVLTQVSRDPGSPTHGSFDRNWWHYKIRDFSSIILQQGAYFLWELAELDEFAGQRDALRRLAEGGARFWARRALRRGAFEEDYPWEQGYPPVAFSTLAVGKLVRAGAVGLPEMQAALLAAARQLSGRFEAQAGNQQVAGLAALAVVRNLVPESCDEARFDELTERTLALQDEEGWFEEYDGPDLGYLAVTIDCLWDLHDVTGDERFRKSAARALGFIHRVVTWCDGSPGMLNARNTDYLVPYGLIRFAIEESADEARKAGEVVGLLFSGLDSPNHFLAAVDDRYLCHYIGHSFARALRLLRSAGTLPATTGAQSVAGGPSSLTSCGYELCPLANGKALIAGNKGGCFLWHASSSRIADYGWVVSWDETCAVNHWWSRDWSTRQQDKGVEVSGHLFEHSAATSSPLKHMALRILSFVFGRRLIAFLKGKLIFKSSAGTIAFRREITGGEGRILVRDEFSNLPTGATIERAPRTSKRHVSSADSFHDEDLSLTGGCQVREERVTEDAAVVIETTYRIRQLSS